MLDAITKKQIKSYVLDYLKIRIPDFVQSSHKGLFSCPKCKQLSANIYPPKSGIVHCFTPECGKQGDIFDICRAIDFPGQDLNDEDISDLLIQELGIKTSQDVQKWFERYASWGWSLVPVSPNKNGFKGKEANIEKEWEKKEHKNIAEWIEWQNAELNFGLHAGKISNSTLIDIDTKEIPLELQKFIGQTLTQTTKKGCFDKETEVLTDKGWKFFKDLDKTEKIAQWNNHQIEYVVPLNYYKYICAEDLYHISNESVDFCVTGNHNIFANASTWLKYNYRFYKAEDIYNNYAPTTSFAIPATFKWTGKYQQWWHLPQIEKEYQQSRKQIIRFKMNDWLEFLGWYLSEGCLFYSKKHNYNIYIWQNKKENYQKIKDCLLRLKLNFYESTVKRGDGNIQHCYIIHNKQLFTYLKQFGKAPEKFIPNEFLNLPPHQLQHLYDSLMLGDGDKYNTYYTSSSKLKDCFCELNLKLGFRSSITYRHRNPKHHPSWEIQRLIRKRGSFHPTHIKKVPYNDYVYCVEVPSHILITRRNSKTNVCGNSHLLYFYEPELPSIDLRDTPCALPVEIRNASGWQTVIYPSIVEGHERTWNDSAPTKMPDELKIWLLSKCVIKEEPKEILTSSPEELLKDLKIKGLDGRCNSSFVKLGGLLRKQLNLTQTEFTLGLLNDLLLDSPMPRKDIKSMMKELAKYSNADYSVLTKQIVEYLTKHTEASARDLQDVLKAEKRDLMEAISNLLSDGAIYKQRSLYKIIERPNWKQEFLSESKVLDFEVPYFNQIATFRNSDLITLGASTGVGKSFIALNIIKKLVDQKIHPYYISSEPGNRFANISTRLGLREGQFSFINHYNPQQLTLEPNSVSIIDWLLPEDYASVDKLYKIFSQQLDKSGGLLFIFSQLRENGTFYSEAMVQFFSAFSVKYFYTKSGNVVDNVNTYFETTKVREPKTNQQVNKIPMKFDNPFLELRKNT